MINQKKLVSICIPVLNEIGNIALLYNRLKIVTDELKDKYDFEFIFTDNHSEDGTWGILIKYSNLDTRVKAIRFTKNIGFQESIFANLNLATGHAMIQIDADLQDPPELIKNFLQEWENGSKIVYGIRASRKENILISSLRKLGYRIISIVSTHQIPVNVGDFRLIDKDVKNLLIKSKVPYPYIRGMIASFEIPSIGISYSREKRVADKSKFPLRQVFRLGMNGVVNHSSWPLRLPMLFGGIVLGITTSLTCYKILVKLSDKTTPVIIENIFLFTAFGIGLNAVFLGVIGVYLNRMYLLLKNEPKYIVEESLNLEIIK